MLIDMLTEIMRVFLTENTDDSSDISEDDFQFRFNL